MSAKRKSMKSLVSSTLIAAMLSTRTRLYNTGSGALADFPPISSLTRSTSTAMARSQKMSSFNSGKLSRTLDTTNRKFWKNLKISRTARAGLASKTSPSGRSPQPADQPMVVIAMWKKGALLAVRPRRRWS